MTPESRSFTRRLSRRAFLALSGLGLLALRSRVLGAQTGKRAIVIGAGAAGLAAAAKLQAAGVDTTVLEARARIGGRIHSVETGGVVFDLGAAWIHGAVGANPFYQLAERAGLETVASDFDSLALFRGAQALPSAEINRLQARAGAIVRQAVEFGGDRSLESVLRLDALSAEDRAAVRWLIFSDSELEYASTAAELSARVHDEDSNFPGDHNLFPDGAAESLEPLSEGLNIRLSTVVQRVRAAENEVEVHSAAGVLRAEVCVVAAPLPVLSSGLLRIEPALPQSFADAAQVIRPGLMNKVAMVFPRQFWPDRERFGSVSHHDRFEFWNLAELSERPALVALCSGREAEAIDRGSAAQAVQLAMANLRSMFPSAPMPIAAVHSAWRRDRFAGGSYVHVAPGGRLADIDAFAKPIADRIFFAGEHTHRRYPGTVHGALLSGERAAREALDALE